MKNLKSVALNKFLTKHPRLTYKKGEVIIQANQTPAGAYLLLNGYIKQYIISQNGEELVLHILSPEIFFPRVWLFNGVINKYFFEALTDVEVIRIPREESLNLLRSDPEMQFSMTRHMLTEVGELFSRFEYLVFGSAQSKVIATLLYLHHCFCEEKTRNVVIEHWFTHQSIADLCGLARETVSIEMNKLEKQGLIGYDKHNIVLKNVEKLESVLAEV